ncbi:DNA repair protein RadC [Sedimentibacter hydroxybenzoicus DSM 7310]|uniref:DNA repair protein RadC n=1 Tax=Sedimentibacter hydroxybenzoicus DSM 7310 TaxID=1123245 RepID=A0A974GVY1_SEDHY|nr:DNA repair protein RadC [Sedimentibacter hydroxybenzoicus]NYB73495.1 DNA repair protein RadC [Sedimentibacter hydroxybenzoicus DSM 7310]
MEKSIIKERVQKYGVDSLMDWELLHLLTSVEPEELQQFKDFNDLRDKIEMLKATDIQKQKVRAVFSIFTRIGKENTNRTKISSPSDAYELLKWEMEHLKKEEFRVVLLDTKNHVIDVKTISVGSLNSSIVSPQIVMKEAIINSASSVILAHNHPSGNSESSREDFLLTERLIQCFKLVGISVIDHIIIGQNNFYSFKEDGLI